MVPPVLRSGCVQYEDETLAPVARGLLFSLALVGCNGGPQKDIGGQQPPATPTATLAYEPTVSPAGGSVAESKGAVKTILAVVIFVSDSDTVQVKLDTRDERVRLIGVNCPEIFHPDLVIKEEPYGQEARAHRERQLNGKKIWPGFDIQERDKYGRLLAYVRLEPPTSGSEGEVRAKMFNVRLLLEGYA